MPLTTRTVTGTYQRLDGSPTSGGVTFTPNAALTAGSSDVMVPASPVAVTLVNGAFAITLVCTDNAGVSPTGWAYTVVERIAGADRRTYTISVPAGGSALDLADVTPLITVPTLVTYALASDLATETARAVAAEGTKTAKPTVTTLGSDLPGVTSTSLGDMTGLGVTLGVGTFEVEWSTIWQGSVGGGGSAGLGPNIQLVAGGGLATSGVLRYRLEIQTSASTRNRYFKTAFSSAQAPGTGAQTANNDYELSIYIRLTTTVGGTLMPQYAVAVGLGAGTLLIKSGSQVKVQAA